MFRFDMHSFSQATGFHYNPDSNTKGNSDFVIGLHNPIVTTMGYPAMGFCNPIIGVEDPPLLARMGMKERRREGGI